jgi:hypothetical protein
MISKCAAKATLTGAGDRVQPARNHLENSRGHFRSRDFAHASKIQRALP